MHDAFEARARRWWLTAVAFVFLGIALPARAQPDGSAAELVCHYTSGPQAGRSERRQAGEPGQPCDDGAGSQGGFERITAMADTIPLPPPHPAPHMPLPAMAEHPIGAPPPTPGPAEAESFHVLATRLFVPAQYNLPAGYGAVAVVAFPVAPADGDTRDRYIRICKAYVTVLRDAKSIAQLNPNQPQMVTLWPRDDLADAKQVEGLTVAQLDKECADAVDHYSYAAAAGWLQQLPDRAQFGGDRPGPFLIAWAPPSNRGQPDVALLTYDLSDLDEAATLQSAFGVWSDEIEGNPTYWAKGWDMTRLKLRLHDVVDKYGGLVLAGFNLLPKLN